MMKGKDYFVFVRVLRYIAEFTCRSKRHRKKAFPKAVRIGYSVVVGDLTEAEGPRSWTKKAYKTLGEGVRNLKWMISNTFDEYCTWGLYTIMRHLDDQIA